MLLHCKNKQKVYFSKMHGLGNDFIIINCIKKKFFFSPDVIKKLSNRHTGIGFDQLLLVEQSHDSRCDFHYRIFNANGNEVEQCGNGARCFGLFLLLNRLTKKNSVVISTKSQDLIITFMSHGMIKVNMNEPSFNLKKILLLKNLFIDNFVIHLINENVKCSIVSIGNPHCIIQVQSINHAPVEKIGIKLEKNIIFPQGINVSFMQIIDKHHIKLRVYERDVGETQACGSAACAAVATGIIRNILDHIVHVDLLGGSLIIQWKGIGHALYMTGPAQHVYEGWTYI